MNYLLSTVFLGVSMASIAQQNTVASGGDASGAGGSVSFSVGQIDYVTQTGAGGTANQGVQQPYEIFLGYDDLSFEIQANLFPNPASEAIQLQFSNWEAYGKAIYRLYDDRGRLIRAEQITGELTFISLADLPNAPYQLTLVLDDQLARTFKVIKNQ